MESDLVKRLRAYTTGPYMTNEAADSIEALEAELAALRKEAAEVVRPWAEQMSTKAFDAPKERARAFLAKLEEKT